MIKMRTDKQNEALRYSVMFRHKIIAAFATRESAIIYAESLAFCRVIGIQVVDEQEMKLVYPYVL